MSIVHVLFCNRLDMRGPCPEVPGAAPHVALLRAVKKCCAGSSRDGNLQRVLGGRQAGLEAPLPCPHCHEQLALQPAHAQLQRSTEVDESNRTCSPRSLLILCSALPLIVPRTRCEGDVSKELRSRILLEECDAAVQFIWGEASNTWVAFK